MRATVAAMRCSECDLPVHALGLCLKHYRHDYYMKHREKAIAASRAWELANPERVREHRNESRRINGRPSTAGSAQRHDYYLTHRDQAAAYQRQYRAARPGLSRDLARRWREANRDRHRMHSRAHSRRRYLARKAGDLTGADLISILEQFGMVCHICGGVIEQGDLHFDHVIPLARGGSHTRDNVRPSHSACNIAKGARLPT